MTEQAITQVAGKRLGVLLIALAGTIALAESLLNTLGLSAWVSVVPFAVCTAIGVRQLLAWLSKRRIQQIWRPKTAVGRALQRAEAFLPPLAYGVIGAAGGVILAAGPFSSIHPRLFSADPTWKIEQQQDKTIFGFVDAERKSLVPSLRLVVDFTNRGLASRSITNVYIYVELDDTMVTGVGSIGYAVRLGGNLESHPVLDVAPAQTVRRELEFFFIAVSADRAQLPTQHSEYPRVRRLNLSLVDSLGGTRSTGWVTARSPIRWFSW